MSDLGEADSEGQRPDVPELIARAQRTAEDTWEGTTRLAESTGTDAAGPAELRLGEASAAGRLLHEELRGAREAPRARRRAAE